MLPAVDENLRLSPSLELEHCNKKSDQEIKSTRSKMVGSVASAAGKSSRTVLIRTGPATAMLKRHEHQSLASSEVCLIVAHASLPFLHFGSSRVAGRTSP